MAAKRSPQTLLFSKLNSSSSLQCVSLQKVLQPSEHLHGLVPKGPHHSYAENTSDGCSTAAGMLAVLRGGEKCLPHPDGLISICAAQDAVNLLSCQGKLSKLLIFSSTNTLKSFSLGLLSIYSLPIQFVCFGLPQP